MGPGRKIYIATHGTTADKAAIKGRKICIVTYGTTVDKAAIKGRKISQHMERKQPKR